MLTLIETSIWHWSGFIGVILIFLAMDLGLFHRQAHIVKFREALLWTSVWFLMAMLFAGGLWPLRGKEEAVEFLTGYIIELSLSMDNVFVIALIFAYFRVPLAYQHRVLFWGILGALAMRGVMIGAGAALIKHFHWMLYVLGGFLILTGIKMVFCGEEGVHPEKNIVIRLARKCFPVAREFEGQKFFTKINRRRGLTPLALVLLMVETTDLIFAVDSIPAIFAVTQKPFIVFTSNVFAILGLRSLYFVLANAIGYFRYLKVGLSLVLVFIGAKMLLPLAQRKFDFAKDFDLSTTSSLVIVAGIIFFSIFFSIVAAWRQPAKKL
ncbi:MAG: TerC family protein [Verrucomicrobiota bacterium]|nr:TerC family protein [Verrucomicrobiota bacterium]